MGGHSICVADVSSDECVSPTPSLYSTVRTAGSYQLLCMDTSCKELPADGDQCSGNDPVLRRVTQARWLTVWPVEHIL